MLLYVANLAFLSIDICVCQSASENLYSPACSSHLEKSIVSTSFVVRD